MKQAHSQTHQLTFGPLTFRAVLGLLWMLVRGKRPIILVGVRTRAEVSGKGIRQRINTTLTAGDMQIRCERQLAKDLRAELAERERADAAS
jgi:hypothetical protein